MCIRDSRERERERERSIDRDRDVDVDTAIARARKREARGLSKPSFADLKGGSLERPVQRMVSARLYVENKIMGIYR